MTAVFDFDKTLTYKDTLFGFYKITNKSNSTYLVKRVLLIIAAICFKFKIIDNNRLKEIGIGLFLKGKDKSFIDKMGVIYADTIELNDIYHNDYFKYSVKDRIIVSASLIEYLQPIFPEDKVLSSSLKYSESKKVIGLKDNIYAKEKLRVLAANGIEKIDVLYTDSFSDKVLMNISDKVFLITSGEKKIIKND